MTTDTTTTDTPIDHDVLKEIARVGLIAQANTVANYLDDQQRGAQERLDKVLRHLEAAHGLTVATMRRIEAYIADVSSAATDLEVDDPTDGA